MLKVAGICFVIFLVIQQYISFITKVIKKPKEPKVNNTSFHDELSKLSLSTPKEVRFKNSFNKNQEFYVLLIELT